MTEHMQVRERLVWITDENQDSWLSVPSTNDQLLYCDELGMYALALSGSLVEIVEVTAWYGTPSIADWRAHSNDPVPLPLALSFGQAIWRCLVEAGVPTWSSDPHSYWEWGNGHVVLYEDASRGGSRSEDRLSAKRDWRFRAIPRTLLKTELTALREREAAIARSIRERERRRGPSQKLLRHEARIELRNSPEYDDTFKQVFGRSQAEVLESAPKNIVLYAHYVTEYRLGLVWNEELSRFVCAAARSPEAATPKNGKILDLPQVVLRTLEREAERVRLDPEDLIIEALRFAPWFQSALKSEPVTEEIEGLKCDPRIIRAIELAARAALADIYAEERAGKRSDDRV